MNPHPLAPKQPDLFQRARESFSVETPKLSALPLVVERMQAAGWRVSTLSWQGPGHAYRITGTRPEGSAPIADSEDRKPKSK